MTRRHRLATTSCIALVLGLAASALPSCANSPPPVPIKHDAGVKKKDAGKDVFVCGAIGDECCEPPTPCNVGAFCGLDGICKNQHPSDIGTPCSSPSSCSSGICGYTQGISDGAAPVQDGNGTPPPQTTGCTVGCYSTTPDCPPGWTCDQLTVGEGVCSCTWAPEKCDGMDNNCDGIVDNQPEVDNDCTLTNMGIPQKCVKGMCECVNTCNSVCVDITIDQNNCGKCNNVCKAMVEKCVAGECACAYTICDGQCVDTGGSDNANCGGCGKTCDYQCASGSCGPVTIASSLENPTAIALDDAYVYFLADGTYYDEAVQYCPLAGCPAKGPAILASVGGDIYASGLSAIVVAGGSVYFPGADVIDLCDVAPKGCGKSGTPSVFANTGTYSSPRLGASATTLGWALQTYPVKSVDSCALGKTCPTPTTVSTFGGSGSGIDLEGFTVGDDNNAYWAIDDYLKSTLYIRTAPITGGKASTVCGVKGVNSVASMLFVGGNIYFTSTDSYSGVGIYVCPTGGADSKALVFNADTNSPSGLASDGTDLFWTEQATSGAIMKCALGTSCPKATTLVSGRSEPYGIAVNATSVYWTEQGSTTSGVYVFHK